MGIIKKTARYLRINQTYSEQIFWELVRKKRFHGLRIQRQYPIKYKYANRRLFFVADFYCHKLKLVIEIDGGIHLHTRERDRLRDMILAEYGYKTLRISAEDVIQYQRGILKKIEKYLNLR